MQSFENELSEIARGLHNNMEFQCDPEATEHTMCLQVYHLDGTPDHGCVITSAMRAPLTSENPMPYLFLEPGSQPDPLLDAPATLEAALGMIEDYQHGWCYRDAYIFMLQQDIERLAPEVAHLTIENELLIDDLLEAHAELAFLRTGQLCECDTVQEAPVPPLERRLTQVIARATEELRQANQALLGENQAMFRDNQAMCLAYQALLEESQTLHGANQTLYAYNQELSSESQGLHQSCQALQAEKHELNQTRQAFQAEKHELNQTRQAFQAEHQALHEANQALSAKLASQESAPRPASGSDAEIAELRSQLRFMQNAHAEMAVKFNEADELRVKYFNKAKRFHEAGTKLGTSNRRLRARIQELKKELASSCSGTDKADDGHSARECEELQAENQRLQDVIKTVSARFDVESQDKAKQIADLTSQLAASALREASANKNLNAQGVRITGLQRQVDAMSRLATMPRWGDAANQDVSAMGL